jgi:hypothetical protein
MTTLNLSLVSQKNKEGKNISANPLLSMKNYLGCQLEATGILFSKKSEDKSRDPIALKKQ